jgi:uncharacterized surface anchored protein
LFHRFLKVDGNETWQYFQACDADDATNDGDVTVRVPTGTFRVAEYNIPSGYVQPDDANNVDVVSDATTEITVINPTPSTLAIHAQEAWGTPIVDLCWWFDWWYNVNQFCDSADGTTDGVTHIDNLRGGEHSLVLASNVPAGTSNPGTILVNVEWMAANDTTVVFHRPAPKLTMDSIVNGITPTSIEVYFKANQPIHGRIDYGTSNSLGQSALGSPTYSIQKTITVTGLLPDKTYYLRVHIENGNGAFNEAMFTVRTAKSTATGKVVVTKKKSDGTTLPGACFDVYRDAGGGALGAFMASSCDWFEADGNNGKISIAGLSAGSYVLAEFYAPAHYQLAKQVRFSLTTGQTKQLTVIDYGGGAIVHVTSKVTSGATLRGSCFAIYKSRSDGTVGAYVTSVCDYLDGNDGVSNFSGIRAGTYYLWEYFVPEGFIRDPIMQFTIKPDQQSKSITYYNRKVTDTANIVITSIDSLDRPTPGACYALFRTYSTGALGAFGKNSCDWNDGREDGKTYFTGIGAGMYAAVEYIAPKGFIAGKKTTITKVSGQLASKRIRQVAGGVVVKVTTLKGSTTSKAAGACYGLYRYSSGQWQYVTDACDWWDGANDGITRIPGVPAGTYRLYQVATPTGFRTPAYVTITVGSTTRSQTVRMYPR